MKKLFKIGLYVRVSTEEQAENPEGSIKNQEERLREFVKLKTMVSPFGEIREVFTDAGISAKDMNRPSLQRLLTKIESKEIDLVLVTELSRFTRSIKDFSILWEFLEKHDCKFLTWPRPGAGGNSELQKERGSLQDGSCETTIF